MAESVNNDANNDDVASGASGLSILNEFEEAANQLLRMFNSNQKLSQNPRVEVEPAMERFLSAARQMNNEFLQIEHFMLKTRPEEDLSDQLISTAYHEMVRKQMIIKDFYDIKIPHYKTIVEAAAEDLKLEDPDAPRPRHPDASRPQNPEKMHEQLRKINAMLNEIGKKDESPSPTKGSPQKLSPQTGLRGQGSPAFLERAAAIGLDLSPRLRSGRGSRSQERSPKDTPMPPPPPPIPADLGYLHVKRKSSPSSKRWRRFP